MTSNLNVRNFRDSIPLYEAKSVKEFNELLSLKDLPGFITIEKNGEKHYLYNWFAVKNAHGLAPIGYRIPTTEDFKSLTNPVDSSLTKGFTKFNSIGYVDNLDAFVENTGDQLFYWTANIDISDSRKAYSFFYDESKDVVISCYYPLYQNYGLSVRCIEDMDYSLKTKEYSYKEIMPIAYKSIVNAWVNSIKELHSFNSGESVRVTAAIGFSRNGLTRFSLEGIETIGFNLKSKTELENLINNATKKHLAAPYYKGQVVHSLTQVDLTIHYQDTVLRKQLFSMKAVENKNNDNILNLYRAENYGFKCRVLVHEFNAIDGYEELFSDIQRGITRFKSKGPIYAFGSVIPGMGLMMITRSNSSMKSKAGLKKGLLISSITVGAISVASKLYSNHFYRKYMSSSFDLEKNYNKANISQKVFLSSAFIYGALSLIDFTWTFTIGVKNKTVQRKLNSDISRDKPMYLNI